MDFTHKCLRKGRVGICFFLIPAIIFSQAYQGLRYYPPTPTSFYDINDSNSLTVIDKINNYNLFQNVLYFVHKIEDDANNRIHFEMHITGGVSYNIDAESISWLGGVSFKINLFNPKIPNANDILVDINRLHNLVEISGFNLPAATAERINGIESRLKEYDQQFWWKRLSVGATMPFIETEYYDYIRLNYKNIYIFGGYDLGDVITLLIGLNKDKKILLAASVDLSTPLYSLAEDFKNMVSRLLRLPARGGNWYYYD